MALVAYDGFDNYNQSNGDILHRSGSALTWTGATFFGSLVLPDVSSRMNVGDFVVVLPTSQFGGFLTSALVSGTVGFALLLISDGTTNPNVALYDDGVQQLTFTFDTARQSMEIYNGTATLLASLPNNAVPINQWCYFEIAATIDPAAGAVEVRCNGQTIYRASGLNTQATADTQFNGLFFNGSPAGGTNCCIDDLYVTDTTLGPGTNPMNGFLGDVRVVTLYPLRDIEAQWVPASGPDMISSFSTDYTLPPHWLQVSETHNDADVSFNATSSPAATDLFSYGPVFNPGILAVQVVGSFRTTDSTAHAIRQILSSNGSNYPGATFSVPGTYAYFCDIWSVDPASGLAWSTAAANTILAGYELIS
jgi:hypothetical protein